MKGINNGIARQYFISNFQQIAEAGWACEPVLSAKWVRPELAKDPTSMLGSSTLLRFKRTLFPIGMVQVTENTSMSKNKTAGSIFANLGRVKE